MEDTELIEITETKIFWISSEYFLVQKTNIYFLNGGGNEGLPQERAVGYQ